MDEKEKEKKLAQKEIVEKIFDIVQHSQCLDTKKDALEEATRLDATVQAVSDLCDDFLAEVRELGL